MCPSKAYVKLMQQLQTELASQDTRAWVGIADFIFHLPEPFLIDHYINETQSALKSKGYKGDEFFAAAHSLGTVMLQNYIKKNPDVFRGQILMGGALARDKRQNDKSTGLTTFGYPVPTQTLAATKDGLFRISRNAEAYWH